MITSVKYFEEECINRFEKLEDDFIKNPTRLDEYVKGITELLHQVGLKMIQESLESMDEMLCNSRMRKEKWFVESHTTKQLLTSLGPVSFRKTLFTNKETGESEYLLDRIMNFEKHQRLSDDAKEQLLLDTVQTSYQRGGDKTSLTGGVSKQTVKNVIHELKFPEEDAPSEKKQVDYLYLEADEDHISLQFQEKKGDLLEVSEGRKNNCMISKLVLCP